MKRKSCPRLRMLVLALAPLAIACGLSGCSATSPCSDFERDRDIVIRGRAPAQTPASPDSLASIQTAPDQRNQ